MAEVRITPAALKQAETLNEPILGRVMQIVERLCRWPEVSGVKPLSGKFAGFYRMRTGDYRVQFRVIGTTVVIEKIGHRDRFYEWKMNTQVQTIMLAGERFVILPESEYRRLKAEQGEPGLPPPDAKGNYPAAEALRVVLARKFLRRRRAAGLTQVKLAKLAGIRPETLNRLEQGKHTPSIETVNRLDKALSKAETRGER